MKNCLETAWAHYIPYIPPGVNVSDPLLSAGILIGGVNANTQFIISAKHHYDGRASSNFSITPGMMFLMCADDKLAGDVFDPRLEQNMTQEDRQLGLRFDTLMRSAAETIRHMEVEVKDKYIGGTIRYAVIERGKPYYTNTYYYQPAI